MNAGGIDQSDGIAVEIEMHLDDVARRACIGRNNCNIAPGQAAFINVDLPTLGAPAIATTSPSRRRSLRPAHGQHIFDFGKQMFHPLLRGSDEIVRYVTLVREIDGRFDQRRRLDDLLTPIARMITQQPFQLPKRLAPLPIGIRVDQIVEALQPR